MSPQRRGLGRGLDALFGEPKRPDRQVETIAVDRIRPNPFQPRKRFDDATMNELRSSIAEYGVLIPIIVRARDDVYELIAGERRWRAAAALQQATIPAIVRAADDRETLEVAIVENLQREDLGPLEEAAGFAQLMEAHGYTQERLAERLAKSRPAIANALRLLTLSDAIKALVADARLSAGHARALLAAPERERLALAHRAITEGLSVRQLERLAGAVKTQPNKTRSSDTQALTADEQDFESRLRFRLGTHVALRRSGAGGKIEIKFANEKDLMRVADILIGDGSSST
ncbi:MAG: ParB/RepB/Spo0J family partition protein [Candidatus Eremiobacteraeota bacterium]|nr:ParB/RepB/Spo0J family partition protein [Candidatus Eremiobacteraeota bacterium]MBV9737686.1 ParB/RepB/Spo0J family partition protein [Candidatus Eremiobacteraeota bacterium]